MTRKVAEAIVRLLERAEESEAHGDVNRARELLEELVVAIDADSDVRSMTRCVELATRIGDHNLALHYALCVWCARPGQSAGHRAVSGAALFHPDRRVSGAGYRICLHRARSSDWHAIATADPYSAWPRITDICDHGAGGAPSVVDLSNANLMRRIGPEGTGVWAVKRARVTQAGRSVAIGVQETAPNGRPAFVSALSVWDPSAALRWDRPPTDAFNRLGVLATRFSYSGYWHWLFEGLSYAVRLDEEGLLMGSDRLAFGQADRRAASGVALWSPEP